MNAIREHGLSHNSPGLLIASGDVEFSQMLSAELESHGLMVFSSGSGKDAVDLFNAHSSEIAIALLDVDMPGMDGPETLRELRRYDPAITACFMADVGTKHSFQYLLDHQVAFIFLKPFDVRKLVDFICRLPFFAPNPLDEMTRPSVEHRRFRRWHGNELSLLVSRIAPPIRTQPAAILDRSLGGLAILVSEPCPVDSVVDVRSGSDKGKVGQFVEVRHVRKMGEEWAMGCRFVGPPPLGLLLSDRKH